jgi:hypothetical protein
MLTLQHEHGSLLEKEGKVRLQSEAQVEKGPQRIHQLARELHHNTTHLVALRFAQGDGTDAATPEYVQAGGWTKQTHLAHKHAQQNGVLTVISR